MQQGLARASAHKVGTWISCVVAAALLALAGGVMAQDSKGDSVRAELGKTLNAVQALIQANKHREALAHLKEADAIKDRSPYETYVIERLRGSAAARIGDNETAIRAFEAVLASGRLSPRERTQFQEALVAMHYRTKDYAGAIEAANAYFKSGGNDASIRTLYHQSLYLKGDFAALVRELTVEIEADEKAGRHPPEEQLQLLANSYLKLSNQAGYLSTLQRLLASYPKKEYWTDAVYRVAQLPGMRERLALDLARLRLALGQARTAADFIEPAQLALQAGLPMEANRFLDPGFAAGVLGAGAEGERHKRLRDMAKRQSGEDTKSLAEGERQALASKDGALAITNGYNLVLHGQKEKGLELMAAGFAKGGLKSPADARLLLGYAQYLAGQPSKAAQTMRSLTGNDPAAVLAHLWVIHLSSGR